MAVEAQSIADDQEVLFAGTKEDFEALGFNESQIGGLEKQNGQLVFSEAKFQESENLKKPLAMGKDLKQFLNDAQTDMTDAEVDSLFINIGSIYNFLDQARCNPLTTERKNSLLTLISGKFINGTALKVLGLVNQWLATVRLAD